MDMTR